MPPGATDTTGTAIFMRMGKMSHAVFPEGNGNAGIRSAGEGFAPKNDGHLVAGQLTSFRLNRRAPGGSLAGSQE